MATREAVKVSGKSIAAFYERMQQGARIECIGNTFRSAAIGLTGEVLRSDRSTVTFRRDDTGQLGSILIPRRVSGVMELTDDTITYQQAREKEHTATWRIVTEAVR